MTDLSGDRQTEDGWVGRLEDTISTVSTDGLTARIAVVGISILLGSAPSNSSAVLRLRSWGRSAVPAH